MLLHPTQTRTHPPRLPRPPRQRQPRPHPALVSPKFSQPVPRPITPSTRQPQRTKPKRPSSGSAASTTAGLEERPTSETCVPRPWPSAWMPAPSCQAALAADGVQSSGIKAANIGAGSRPTCKLHTTRRQTGISPSCSYKPNHHDHDSSNGPLPFFSFPFPTPACLS